ncbi:MAG: 2-phosphosulfolactate phosphatase [Arenicellales bacterium]
MEREHPDGGRTIHVVMRKEDLDPDRVADKTVLVVDVLFATTSIITVLARGISVVYPARDADEARELAKRSDIGRVVLAGETMFRDIKGFAPPTPLALCRHIGGRDALIYATTNGTVALRLCAGARRVLLGSLLNAGATARALGSAPDTVVILCAGTAGAFNLEDFYGAGCLVQRILQRRTDFRLTDAARAALDLFEALDARAALQRSYVGRLMHEWDLDPDVAYASRIDELELAAELRDGCIRVCGGSPGAGGIGYRG